MNFERIPPIWLDETDSTNAEALRMLKQGNPPEGSCIVARFQREGRGQRSNNWNSRPGENLLVSFILYPPIELAKHPFLLSKSVAIAVQETLQSYTNRDVRIKWPNDMLIDGKKAAGILIENLWQGAKWHAAVVGIGINVNQKTFAIDHATSLNTSYEEVIPIESVLSALQVRLSSDYNILCNGSIKQISERYDRGLFGKTDYYSYACGAEQIRAKVAAVYADGRIELLTDSGLSKTFDLHEVRFIY
jgi:BirA family biotin operon repressor/biotin-[acetyl-CoA-carboxylase] ligase